MRTPTKLIIKHLSFVLSGHERTNELIFFSILFLRRRVCDFILRGVAWYDGIDGQDGRHARSMEMGRFQLDVGAMKWVSKYIYDTTV